MRVGVCPVPMLRSTLGASASLVRHSHSQTHNRPLTVASSRLPSNANKPSSSRFSSHRSACAYLESTSSTSTWSSIKPTNQRVNPLVNVGVRFMSSSTNIDNNTATITTIIDTPPVTTGTAMADEYGEMTADGETHVETNFVLEDGTILPHAQLRYQTYGSINADRTNVLVVCHALTGNASLHSWWGELLGPGKAFDTSKYMVVCCNILGSCYGSTSPRDMNPATGKPYSKDFPDVSVKDTVRLQLLLLKALNVKSIKAVIGGSFGGMQAMEFAVQAGSSQGDFFDDNGSPYLKSVIPIACGAAHTAWQIAVSEVQRQAIYADPHWNTDEPEKATAGLSVARQMGMVSYRTAQAYQDKFGRDLHRPNPKVQPPVAAASGKPYGSSALFDAQSYLHYQGQKFLSRFDPVTYVKMTEQMDSYDISRGRNGTLEQVLARIEIPALVMGIDSDVLYPLPEQEFLAQHLPRGELKVIHSPDGHDGFLLEQDQVGNNIAQFLNEN